MAAQHVSEVAGEHALRVDEPDRLGFAEVAGRIANSIVDRASVDGLVIGLDGEWGSGKSSLLHLIARSLGELPKEKRPTIINFRPWLVGDRDALLTSLFSELADGIALAYLASGDASPLALRKAKKAAKAVKQFARALGKAGELIETAGTFWGPLGVGGKILRAIGSMSEENKAKTDLAALKDKITRDLRSLNHRFIITVDDVDRLEPSEAIEVLRLVRSVADFPNIIYLLCYDADRLAEAIETGARVSNGAVYLEKIVQLTVMIPKPEPFELRQWFAQDLEKMIGLVSDYEVRDRLKTVIDQEGGIQLRTPRSVVRTMDSIRFFWPAMRGENIDVSDLVWLQLIKDGSPKLYRWIETYVASVAATSFGTTTVSDSGKEASLKALVEAVREGQLSDIMYRHMFSEMLPGIESSYGGDGSPVKIHEKVSPHDRQAAINARRLASPDHYRLYFSLIGPSHAITQAGFDGFWLAAETSPDETADYLLLLHGQMALGTLRKSDVLLERLRTMDTDLWTSLRAKNVLLAFGQMMDDVFRIDPSEENFIVSSWDRAERLVPILYARIPEDQRAAINEQLFAHGAALGWLTSVLRREIFAHGRFGGQRKPPSEWWLPEAEFAQACDLMLTRYRSMSMEDILATPRPIHILYAWNQAGDETGPRALLAEATTADADLVEILNALTSSITSSERGRYTVLKSQNVEPFMDYEAVWRRLNTIASEGPLDVRDKAKRLLGFVEAATDS